MAETFVYPVGDGLYVNLTNRCPCACRFCIRQNGEGVYGSDSLWLSREPAPEEVCAALDAAGVATCREVVFCGYGEPTERLDALLAVAAGLRAKHPARPIRVNTNGLSDLIAGEPTAARFAGLVDALSISLNAAPRGAEVPVPPVFPIPLVPLPTHASSIPHPPFLIPLRLCVKTMEWQLSNQ